MHPMFCRRDTSRGNMDLKIFQNDTQTHTYCQFSGPQIQILKGFYKHF